VAELVVAASEREGRRCHPAVLLCAGGFTALLGLTIGGRIGGPVARRIFGTPAGFKTDATALEALGQALAVLLVFVVLGFIALGAVLARVRRRITTADALWASNPATMFAAFGLHFWMGNQLEGWQMPYEYVSSSAWMLSTFLGPAVCVPALMAGWRATVSTTVLGSERAAEQGDEADER
jgi:hypothetical protein